MFNRTVRHGLLIAALLALPGLAAAQGTQAGDNGRQPVGADADSPRQAIPNASTNDGRYYNDNRVYYQTRNPDGTRYYYDNRVYYQAHDPDRYPERYPLRNCEELPLSERPACRDAMYHHEYYPRLAQ